MPIENVGVDIDGVLNDFMSEYEGFCLATYGDFQMDFIDEKRLMAFYESEIFKKMLPENGAVDGIEKLSRYYDLHIITGRPSYVKEETIIWIDLKEETTIWIERYFPKMFKSITLTNFNKNGNKYDICKKLGCNKIIEDDFTFLKNIPENDEKFKVYLYARPYNTDLESKSNVVRIGGWQNLTDLLIRQKV